MAVVVACLFLERDVLLEAFASSWIQLRRNVARDLEDERHEAMRCERLVGRVAWRERAQTPSRTDSSIISDRAGVSELASRYRHTLLVIVDVDPAVGVTVIVDDVAMVARPVRFAKLAMNKVGSGNH